MEEGSYKAVDHMAQRETVLISAAGGDIALGVLRSLRAAGRAVRTIGIDISPDAAGLYVCDMGYVVPKASEEERYLEQIMSICVDEKVTFAFICNEAEQRVIAKHLPTLQKKLPTYFLVQPNSVLAITMDKYATCSFLKGRGIRVPESAVTKDEAAAIAQRCGFPLALKSRFGSGSKHFYKMSGKAELAALWKKVPEPILQEYIGDEETKEYTVGIFLDKHSRALGSIAMERELRFGLTWIATAQSLPDVEKLAILAAETVGAVGPCNVQLRRDARGELAVIEINARLSSTVPMRALLGFNEANASLDYFLYGKKPSFNVQSGFCVRSWSEVVVEKKRHDMLVDTKKISNTP